MGHEQDQMTEAVLELWALTYTARETWTQRDLALPSVAAS